jgi:hypothetical protein
MRTWEGWQPDEWPTERTERAWTPQTPCPFQERGLTCPNGGVHRLSTTWQDCFLQFGLGEYYAMNDGRLDAPPPPSLDVAATDDGGSPRPARRATREQSAPVRAGLARRAWAAVRAAARYAWDAAPEAVADVIAGGSSRAVGGEIRARGDEPVDTVPAWLTGPAATCDQCNDDPATYDPGPTYGWGPIHTGRGWRRWF